MVNPCAVSSSATPRRGGSLGGMALFGKVNRRCREAGFQMAAFAVQRYRQQAGDFRHAQVASWWHAMAKADVAAAHDADHQRRVLAAILAHFQAQGLGHGRSQVSWASRKPLKPASGLALLLAGMGGRFLFVQPIHVAQEVDVFGLGRRRAADAFAGFLRNVFPALPPPGGSAIYRH
jgi:hypothetical protein